MEDLFDSEELFALARLDLKKGDVALGLGRLKQALRLPGCPVPALVEAARVYAQLGMRAKAQPLFQRYVEQSPGDIDARFQLGMISFEEGQFGPALTLWEEVLHSAPDYPPALFFRAAAISSQGNVAEARRMLRGAMEVIAVDNLYFTRSRDLLAALDAGQANSTPLVAPDQTYKTQH